MHAEHADNSELNELSGRVIRYAFTVPKGFLGKVYENCGPADRRRTFGRVERSVKALDDARRMQRTNYLKATGLQLCLLLNFGKRRREIKRVAHGL